MLVYCLKVIHFTLTTHKMDISEVRRTDSCNLGYSDELLKYIGGHLHGSWRKLGINLGIRSWKLDHLHKIKYTHEMALEVLQSWWAKTNTHSRWGELHHALLSISRQDLLSLTQDHCKKNSMDYNDPEELQMEQLFLSLSEGLASRWKEFGLYLGIPLDKLTEIGQQPIIDTTFHTFHVLKMWQELPESSHHQLIRVLGDDMSRGDLVRYICKHFEKRKRQGSIVCDCDGCEKI